MRWRPGLRPHPAGEFTALPKFLGQGKEREKGEGRGKKGNRRKEDVKGDKEGKGKSRG